MWLNPTLLAAFAQEQTSAHRLATFADGWVERLGEDLLVHAKSPERAAALVAETKKWAAANGLAWRRIFQRILVKQAKREHAPRLVEGPADLPLQTVAQENGLKFHLDFGAGYSTGLFLDQRANRMRVRQLAPKRLLNCFAYTCSFSVAGAALRAQTVSVDLSKKSLSWGRKNFEANGLSHEGHRFIADDVFGVLGYLARKEERFDMIILDPPTFSRAPRGKTFRAAHDWPELLALALEVAAPKAHVLVSTNSHQLGIKDLEQMARGVLKNQGVPFRLEHAPQLPDFPPGAGASTVWVALT